MQGSQNGQRTYFRTEGPFWRKLANFGATRAPEAMVRYSPPAWGWAFALALPHVRKRVRANLRRVLGPRSRLAEELDAARTFANFASCLTEALAVGGPNPRRVERVVSGRENLDRALAPGKGVILVTAHTGGWETTGPLLKSDFGLNVLIAMESESDAEARAIQDAARARSGVKVAHVGSDPLAILSLFTHLRAGGVIGIQLDRVPGGMRGIPVSLFGESTRVPQGPFDLAAATGAPILPIFAHRIGYFRYAIDISAPLFLEPRPRPDAVSRCAQAAASEMARFVREHPTHWFHFAPPPKDGGPAGAHDAANGLGARAPYRRARSPEAAAPSTPVPLDRP